MAEAGLVPERTGLSPGDDVELPDAKAWTYYYREANPRRASGTSHAGNGSRGDAGASEREASSRGTAGRPRIEAPRRSLVRSSSRLRALRLREDSGRAD